MTSKFIRRSNISKLLDRAERKFAATNDVGAIMTRVYTTFRQRVYVMCVIRGDSNGRVKGASNRNSSFIGFVVLMIFALNTSHKDDVRVEFREKNHRFS